MRRSLTREERLKRKADFDAVFSDGRRKSCSGARLVYKANSLTWSRFAVCPVRGFGGSVKRNRVRRHGKEAYRLMKERVTRGFDLILVVYPGAERFHDRYRQLETLLRKAGLLENAQ